MEEAYQAAENTRRGRPFSHHEKRKKLEELLSRIEERKRKKNEERINRTGEKTS